MATELEAPTRTGSPSLTDKLLTKEDPWHVHKTLGIACLLSFAWRFSQPWESQMGFVTHPHLTIPTVLLHMSLNLTSFVFRIPSQRIKTNGGRIWPEYRLHALIFLTRTCLAVLIRHFLYHGPSTSKHQMTIYYWLNYCLILANCASADLASWSCGAHSSRSIRDAKLPVFVRYYFSLMQFFGTAMIMASTNYSMVFYYAFVVQLNPFGMTLVRKNIISHEFNMALYAVELGLGIPLTYKLGYKDPYFIGAQVVGFFAAFWRMGPWPRWVPRNKYLVWTGTFALFQTVVRPVMEHQDPWQVQQMTTIADLQVVSMFAYLLYRHVQQQRCREREKQQEDHASIKAPQLYTRLDYSRDLNMDNSETTNETSSMTSHEDSDLEEESDSETTSTKPKRA